MSAPDADGNVELVFTDPEDTDLFVDALTTDLRDPFTVDQAGAHILHPFTLRCPHLGAHPVHVCRVLD